MKSARNNILPEVPVKIWNSTFISVFITNMLMQFGQQMCNSLVPKYADYLNATPTIVGMVTSLFAVTALVFKFVSAPAIDTFNRKFILAGAMAVLGIAYVGYSFSNSIPALMVFRLIQGIGLAFTATCSLALASDALPPEKLGSGIGYFSLAQAACMAVAPTVALMLMDAIGYSLTFAIAAVCMFVSAVIATRLKFRFVRTRKFKISISSIVAKEVIIPRQYCVFYQRHTV